MRFRIDFFPKDRKIKNTKQMKSILFIFLIQLVNELFICNFVIYTTV